MRPIDLMNAMNDLPEDYIARELAYHPPKKSTAPFRVVIATAACLLVTLGLVRGVWMKRQPIETVPPQETLPTSQTSPTEPITTVTTAVPTSETDSETETAASESASETAFTETSAWIETIETVTLPAQSIPSLTQTASTVTIAQSTPPATTVTSATTAKTDPTEAATETDDTAEQIAETEAPTIVPTDPLEETSPAEEIIVPTDPIEFTDPPEPTDPTEPYSLPANLTADASGRDPLEGFHREERLGRTVLTVTPESDDPMDFSLSYTCTDRRYFQSGTSTDVDGGIWFTEYHYLDMQTGNLFHVRLCCRSQFRLEYQSDMAQLWRLDSPAGCIFLHCNTGNYLLYDDGNYVMQMEYTDPQLDYQGFLEHFVPKQ